MRQKAREISRHFQNGSVGPLWDGLERSCRLLWCGAGESREGLKLQEVKEGSKGTGGELRLGCGFLPHAPGAAHVIGQRHGDENDEGEESGSYRELGELGAVADVHEKENYE